MSRARIVPVVVAAGLVASLTASAPALASQAAVRVAGAETCEIGTSLLIDDPDSASVLTGLGYPGAHQYATGRGVTVVVADTGVNPDNPHLKGAVDPVVEVGDAVGEAEGGPDPDGLGTGVAGIIAARAVEDSVLVGIAPDARIRPIRVVSRENHVRHLANGIRKAVDDGADVVAVPFATSPLDPGAEALEFAVQLALNADVVVVAAVGDRVSVDEPAEQMMVPASLNGVIGVTASNTLGVVDDTAYRSSAVDIAAPGEGVLTAFHADGDCVLGGDAPSTRWATAYVAGTAAALRERFPEDSAAQISNRLLGSATRSGDQRDDTTGWGRLDPVSALTTSTSDALPESGVPEARGDLVEAPDPRQDPWERARSGYAWWLIIALGLGGIALMLRPALHRRPAHPPE